MPSIRVIRGDITKVEVDAIVNAANSSLVGGGGVDGAIHRAGGPDILEECRKIRARQGGCPTGEAVITTAGRLSSKYVIHTVGPVWSGGGHGEEELLANAYLNSLKLALSHNCQTIAFPNISTGVYRFPPERAISVVQRTVSRFLDEHPNSLRSILFVCFDEENYRLYVQAWKPSGE
jgi:O-acetyl-ADP-ribose deacetylase (regulator of RNase III)